MEEYEYEKYKTDIKNLKTTLTKYGVAIIPNVLTKTECKKMLSGIWSFFEHLTQDWETPLSRDDNTTWKEFYKLYPLHNMMIQHYGAGHAPISWKIRQNEKIVNIFAQLYDVNKKNLLVSFDGLSLHLPPEVTKKHSMNNSWYHTDQSYTRNDFECVQSWITALDVNEGDATLRFLEKSHKYHKKIAEEYKLTDKSDWHKLTPKEEKFYIDVGCKSKRIMCPKGSLVLWDSRTIHYGVECLKERKEENLRAIIYLCYMPRELCSSSDLKKKQKAFKELRTTSHYPCKVKLFPVNPHTYGKKIEDVKKITKPKLSKLGLKLAGF